MSKRVFIAWRRLSTRTRELAEVLDPDLVFFKSSVLYIDAFVKTRKFLKNNKPSVVFCQLPQGVLLRCLSSLREKLGFKLVADVHTSFVVYDDWKQKLLNKPFKYLLRKCDLVLVHCPEILQFIDDRCIDIRVVYDPTPLVNYSVEHGVGNYILLPNIFGYRKDWKTIITACCRIAVKHNLDVVVTGTAPRNVSVPRCVKLLGVVNYNTYIQLLANARVVVTCSRRKFYCPRSVFEAISFKVPIIVAVPRNTVLGNEEFVIRVDLQETNVVEALEEVLNNYESCKRLFEQKHSVFIQRVLQQIEQLKKFLRS